MSLYQQFSTLCAEFRDFVSKNDLEVDKIETLIANICIN